VRVREYAQGIGGVRSSRARNKNLCKARIFIFAVTEPPQSPVFCGVPQFAVLRKKCALVNRGEGLHYRGFSFIMETIGYGFFGAA
jgi:hypothetical protein